MSSNFVFNEESPGDGLKEMTYITPVIYGPFPFFRPFHVS